MYEITRDYIKKGNSRSGQRIGQVKFIVSHDTGNPGSTAYQNWKYFNNQQPSAGAHTFIDDKYILEIVPLNEKAWHVQYNKPTDNRLFGADANDAAIGVELCWGGSINFQESYKRYVWYHAYLCKTFNLQPRKHIVSHKTLDPERRSDPENALNRYGITWSQFINDVEKEFSSKKEEVGKVEKPSNVDVKIVQNSEYVGKRLTVREDGLWWYDTPRWDIMGGTSGIGHSFIITEELLVNGVRMVKCHDGKYRSADPKFVSIDPPPSDWPYIVHVENITHKEAQDIVNLLQSRYKSANVYGAPK